jgi:ankyrin repeat protein
LELLGGLDDNVRAEILRQQDGSGRNVLMYALRYGNMHVRMMALKLLGGLDDNVRAEMLRQHTSGGWNMLMHALYYGNDGVRIAALELLGELGDDVRREILKQQDDDKWNVLMYAVRYCSEESAWGKAKECLMDMDSAGRKEIIDCTVKEVDYLCSQDGILISAEEKSLYQTRLNELNDMLRSA